MTPHHRRPSTTTARLARHLAGTALLPALAVAVATPAAAHDELIGTVPAQDETAAQAPTEVALTFSGDLIDGQGIQNLVQVTDAAGSQWQDGEVTVDGPTASVALCEDLPNGEYTVAYRVVYSDGHSEERSYGFAVDDPAAPAAGSTPSDCGVAASGASADAASGGSEDAGASADSTAASTQGSDTDTASATTGQGDDASAQAEATPAAGQGVPAGVWIAGVAGLLVIGLGLALLGRRARGVGRD